MAAEAQWSILRESLVTVAMISCAAKAAGEKRSAHEAQVREVVDAQWRQSKAKVMLGARMAHEAAVARSQAAPSMGSL